MLCFTCAIFFHPQTTLSGQEYHHYAHFTCKETGTESCATQYMTEVKFKSQQSHSRACAFHHYTSLCNLSRESSSFSKNTTQHFSDCLLPYSLLAVSKYENSTLLLYIPFTSEMQLVSKGYLYLALSRSKRAYVPNKKLKRQRNSKYKNLLLNFCK